MTLARKKTPRQRCALAFPIESDGELHPRYHRRTGGYQSILTFDLRRPPEDFSIAGVELVSGQVGMWHGRVSTFPVKDLAAWTPQELGKARQMAQRLVANIGQGSWDHRNAADNQARRIFRWATLSEVAQALRAREGKNK